MLMVNGSFELPEALLVCLNLDLQKLVFGPLCLESSRIYIGIATGAPSSMHDCARLPFW